MNTTTIKTNAQLLKKGNVVLETSQVDESTTVVAVEQDGSRVTLFETATGFSVESSDYITKSETDFESSLLLAISEYETDTIESNVKTFYGSKGILIADTYTALSNGKVKQVFSQIGALVKNGTPYTQEETDNTIAKGNFKENPDYVEIVTSSLYHTYTGTDFDNIYAVVGFNYDNNNPELKTSFENVVRYMEGMFETASIRPQLLGKLIELEITIEDAVTLMRINEEMYTRKLMQLFYK